MLTLFRTNKFAANILLLVYVIVIRVTAFIFPVDWEPGHLGILSEWVYSNIGTTGIAPLIVSILLIFVQAFMINKLVTDYRLNTEINLFPGVFYVLLVSAIPEFLNLSPILMANTFYIIGLYLLFKTYKSNHGGGDIFNAGLSFGVGSLFCFSLWMLLILGFVGLSILRSFRFRERLVLIIGFLVPYYGFWIYHFVFDRVNYFYNYHFLENIDFFDFAGPVAADLYVKIGFFGLLIVFTLLSYGIYMSKKNIKPQKYISILYWALFVSVLTIFFQSGIKVEHLMIVSVPLAIFLGLNFTQFKKPTAEFFHLVIFVGVILLQLKPLWINSLTF